MSKSITPNHREIIAAQSTITGQEEYLLSTNGALNVVASISPPALQDVNITQIGGNVVTTTIPVSGTVSLGAGSQVIGHVITDTTSVTNATLSAETTKVIGTVNQGTSPWVTNDPGLPDTLGQKTSANSTGVVIASDQSAVPVSGTVTGNQGSAAAVTAGWPMINGEPADTTGTFTNGTQTTSVTASSLDGYESVTVSINGTYGTGTAVFEGTDDGGSTWYAIPMARTDSPTVEFGYTSLTNINRMWTGQVTGLDSFRVRSTAVASGTINVRISISSAPTSDSSVAQALITNGTTTPTASTAYISSIVISNEVGGTTSTVTIQDKQGTPLKLVNGLATTALTTAPTVVNFQTPVKMVSGIDIITAGAVAATVDIWINYYA